MQSHCTRSRWAEPESLLQVHEQSKHLPRRADSLYTTAIGRPREVPLKTDLSVKLVKEKGHWCMQFFSEGDWKNLVTLTWVNHSTKDIAHVANSLLALQERIPQINLQQLRYLLTFMTFSFSKIHFC